MWIGTGANKLYVLGKDARKLIPIVVSIEEELLHLDEEEFEEEL